MNNSKIIKLLIFSLIVSLIGSCTLTPPKQANTEDQIAKALQNSVYTDKKIAKKSSQSTTPAFLNQALTPQLAANNIDKNLKPSESRFNISVKDVAAKDFFMGLTKDTTENMTVSPDVTGIISLNLKNVTVAEVMETVRDIYGYEYQHTAAGYEVFAKKMETQMFTVNYLDIDRKGRSFTTVSSGQITSTYKGTTSASGTTTGSETSATKPSSSIDTTNNTDFWKALKDTLESIISSEEGASVVINPQSGIIVAHAYPDALRNISRYLDSIQNIMQRQVIIEARILEVGLNAEFQSGINWNILGLKQSTNSQMNTSTTDSLSSLSSIFTLNITSGDAFNTAISLLNTQGKVNVLSSPRISTVNNQKAIIKVGQDQFFVTSVKSDVATSGIGTNPVITQDIGFTPFFTGIALDVTPQINKQGDVTLHIHPIISRVSEQNKQFTVNGQEQNIPLAQSNIRESDSIVQAKNGQVVVIGGLMDNRSTDISSGTPGLEDTSYFSGLFKSSNKSSQKFELVILLRPIVVGPNSWTEQLQQNVKENSELTGEYKYESKLNLRQN
jgi:MSHA biogenesis protein MshL